MTTTFRNRFFVQGILFGGLLGLVAGCFVAFQVGNARVDLARHTVMRWVRRDQKPDYSKLLV